MAAPDPRLGQVLDGKYRIQFLMARGGMGLVYAARHLITQRPVAIKLLRSELLNRPELVWRVSVEGRHAAVVAHPNVVEILDAGTEGGVPYVVQERLRGEPLEAVLCEPLPLRVTAHLLMPIINAVAHLHRSGMIHRDIKPANIFLARHADGRLTPKLLDFGIAKVLDSGPQTVSGVALGTPAYMAPEQALGSRALGTVSDVWSMAVVFIRCKTGQLPFSGGAMSRPDTLRLRPADMACVPQPVARVLSEALELEPSERLRDMSSFRTRLIAALREVDATYPWPDETSVSYLGAPGDEVQQALTRGARAHAELELSAPGAVTPARARPRDARTRTLLARKKVSFGLRARTKLVLLSAALLSLGAPALRQSDGEASSLTVIEIGPTPSSRLEQNERTLSFLSALPSEPRPSATNEDPERRPEPAPKRAVRAVATEPPRPIHMEAPPAGGTGILGANRSPIIE
jgi:serine/threonine protein kinase